MNKVAEFEAHRSLLFSIAYRLLGSVTEAEDAVQECWLRFERAAAPSRSTKSYLAAVVTNVSIDVLRSSRTKREVYPGPWFPEPLVLDPYQDPERSAELADSVSMAALLLLERLTPAERAVFVLHEVFGFPFAEIASSVGRPEATCRQLAVRARRHMERERPRFDADSRERRELADRFLAALRDGEVDSLRALLAADVLLIGDAGGKAPLWGRGSFGGEHVIRLLTTLVPRFVRMGGEITGQELNGQPGAVFRDEHGAVVNTWTLDIVNRRVQRIASVINPDKLAHLGLVADSWSVERAVRQARPGVERRGRASMPDDHNDSTPSAHS